MKSVFHRAGPSFLPLLRFPTVQKLQTKVLSASIYSEQSHSTGKTAGEKEEIERPREFTDIRRVHVGNLLKGQDYTTEDTVYKYFSKYGKIELLEFFRHKLSNAPRGFAFVTFHDVESAKKVLSEADSHIIDGQKVTVAIPLKMKKPPELKKRDLTVTVNNILTNTSKQEIEEHFAVFGKVHRVIFAQKDPTDENLSRYYVMFSTPSEAQKALEQPTQRIGKQDIDSQVTEFFPQTSKEFTGKTKALSVTSVPDHVTVEDLRDYFRKFGDVECVDFLVSGGVASHNPDRNSNVAFVRFPYDAIVDEVVQNKNQVINGSEVKVSRYRDMANLVNDGLRELKLSVEGLPLSTRPGAVQEYFERTFGVVPNGVFLNQHRVSIDKKLVCIVRFSNRREVEKVLNEQKGIFCGHHLYFRRLVWKKV